MIARLLSLDFAVPTCETALVGLPLVVGCSPDARIRLNDRSVSPQHCRIDMVDGRLTVTDLGSVHGTFINGERISKAVLKPGDVLAVGMLSFFVQWHGERRPKNDEWATSVKVTVAAPLAAAT